MKAFKDGVLAYFAPLIALRLTSKRSGDYIWHLRGLYRLAFTRSH